MKFKPYRPHKNDVFFAFLMAVVFAMTVLGEAVGALSVARGQLEAEFAGAQHAPRDAGDRTLLVARAGVRK